LNGKTSTARTKHISATIDIAVPEIEFASRRTKSTDWYFQTFRTALWYLGLGTRWTDWRVHLG